MRRHNNCCTTLINASKIFIISRAVSISKLPVGSSAITTFGRFTIALAIATRCCSPPESSLGIASARSSRPTRPKTSVTRSRIASGSSSITSKANETFSYTVNLGSNLKS